MTLSIITFVPLRYPVAFGVPPTFFGLGVEAELCTIRLGVSNVLLKSSYLTHEWLMDSYDALILHRSCSKCRGFILPLQSA